MNQPSSATPVPERPSDVVLYQAPDVTVTSSYFDSAGQRFPVVELGEVERVEQGGRLRRSRRYELWAWFRGGWVQLFSCDDEREYGQVCRALMRARERAGVC